MRIECERKTELARKKCSDLSNSRMYLGSPLKDETRATTVRGGGGEADDRPREFVSWMMKVTVK